MTGVYGLFRLLILLFIPLNVAWQMTLALFAVLTMTVGNLMALLQDDLKRMLAFSTIANVGYILLGLSTNNVTGLTGALFQILNHALVKALLFLCTGSFFRQTRTRSLRELEGIGRRMPVSSGLFLLGLISLAGIPPLNMFWSEWTILVASFRTNVLFSISMIGNLVLSAAYCLRVVQSIYIKSESQISLGAEEVSVSLLIPKLMIGVLLVVIGLYAGPFRIAAEDAAKAVLNIQGYVESVLK